jgi:hypothetical protein
MFINDVDFNKGVTNATDRFNQHYDQALDLPYIIETSGNIRSFIETYFNVNEDFHGRFLSYFVETVTFAQYVRKAKNEPQLARDEMLAAMGFLSWLLNSFKHF